MRMFFAVGLLLFLSTPAPAQSSSSANSPRAVVQDFWRTEIGGGRLTEDGWNRAGMFFLHPTSRPVNQPVLVILSGNRVDEVDKDSTHSEVYVGCSELGQLSSNLKFTPSPGGTAPLEMVCKYDLVLTGAHPEWKIANAPAGLRISVDTAIRYAAKMRDTSSDDAIKKNAGATITALRKLR